MDNATTNHIEIGETVKVTYPRHRLFGKTGLVVEMTTIFGALIYVVEIDGVYELLLGVLVERLENV